MKQRVVEVASSSLAPSLLLASSHTTGFPQAEGAHSCLAGIDDKEEPNRLSPGPSNVVGRAHPRGHSGGRPKDELQRDEAVSGSVFLDDSVDVPAGNFEKYVSLGSESSR